MKYRFVNKVQAILILCILITNIMHTINIMHYYYYHTHGFYEVQFQPETSVSKTIWVIITRCYIDLKSNAVPFEPEAEGRTHN